MISIPICASSYQISVDTNVVVWNVSMLISSAQCLFIRWVRFSLPFSVLCGFVWLTYLLIAISLLRKTSMTHWFFLSS